MSTTMRRAGSPMLLGVPYLIGCGDKPKVAAPEPSTPAASPVTWSKSLGLKSLADLDARLRAPWEERLTVSSAGKKTSVRNCADFLSLKSFRALNDQQEMQLRLNAIECWALDAIGTAKPAGAADEFRLTPDGGIKWLPAELGPVVSNEDAKAVQAAAAGGKSWLDYDSGIKAAAGDEGELNVTSHAYLTQLAELARGDFSGRGVQEILIRATSAATEGTWRDVRLFVIGREGSQRVFTVRKRFPAQP